MAKIAIDELLDGDFDDSQANSANRRQQHEHRVTLRRDRRVKRSAHAVLDEIVRHDNSENVVVESYFNPSFSASRHEREWIFSYLGSFYDMKLITDVIKRVKGGKEANVYCCTAHPDTGLELIAAKVYRPRMFRNLRNDARYRQSRAILDEEGKQVLDSRQMRSVAKGTRIGKEVLHTSWLEHEYQTLQLLHASGVNVPKPIACGHNTILMEYIGEEDMAAPTLNQISLKRNEAGDLYERLIQDVRLMLRCNRVHADLSAYNVLYWNGEYRIIDFPQAVDPRQNPDAYDLFRRDVTSLSQYFTRIGVGRQAEALAADLWKDYSEKIRIASLPDLGDEMDAES